MNDWSRFKDYHTLDEFDDLDLNELKEILFAVMSELDVQAYVWPNNEPRKELAIMDMKGGDS